MAQKNIDFGTFPDDPNADAIRTAFQKVQENFTDLYSGLQDQAVLSVNRTAGAGITVNSPTGNVIVTANIAYLRVTTSTLAIGRDGNGFPGVSRDANITQSSQTLYVDLPANIEGVTSAAFSGNVVANNINANSTVNTANLNVTSNASAGNISTTGSLSVTGNANAGNINTVTGVFSNGIQATVAVVAGNLHANSGVVTAGGGTITGNLNVGNLQGILANGTSNVRIPATNGNVNISAAGNANIVVVTGTGANITGTANVAGNLSASNIDGGNTVTANYFVGDGSLLTNVVALANTQIVSGTSKAEIVSSGGNLAVTIGGTSNVLVVSSTGANVTGTLGVSGNANVGNIGATNANVTDMTATGNINAGNLVGPLANGTSSVRIPASAGNINLSVNGNANVAVVTGTGVNVAGTLNATGNANVGNLAASQLIATGNVTSPQLISNVATGTSPLIVSSTTKVANLNADLLDGYSTATAATADTVVIRDTNGSFSANLVTANLSGNATTAGTVVTAAQPNITSVGTLSSLAVTGNVTAGNVYANLGTIGASLLTGTLTTASQPNITSVGTLTSLSVTGNISGANLTGNHYGNGSALSAITGANVTGTVANATYAVSAGSAGSATTAGTVTTNVQPNITSVGTLTGLSVNGNITAANITANTGVFTGNGSGLSAIAGANVTGTVANATYAVSAGSATTAGTVTTNAQPNITSVGTLSTLNVTGNANVGNIGATNGVFTNVSGNGSALSSITGANVTGTVANATYATSAGSATTATSATTAGTVTTAAQPNITSVGTLSSLSVTANVTAGNVYANSGTIGASLLTGTLTTASQPNITSVGTLSSLTVTGNVGAGNVNTGIGNFTGNINSLNANLGNLAKANFFQGDGSLLTNISVAAGSFILNGTSNVTVDSSSNVRTSVGGVANVLVVTTTGANIAGTINATGNANVGNLGATGVVATTLGGSLTTASQPNVTSLGTLTGLTVNGISNLGPNGNVTITGGVNGAFLKTNGSGGLSWDTATLVPAQGTNTQVIFNDGGSYAGNANLTFNKTTGNLSVGGGLTVTGNLSAGNINGANLITGNFVAGTLTTAVQPNITTIGTLAALTVTGTTAANNFNATNYANAKYIIANAGSITSNIHSLTVLQTWNNSSVRFSALEANITDTASAANSLLLDLQISNVSKFAVSKEGNVFFSGTITGDGAGLTNISSATSATNAAAVQSNTSTGTTVYLVGTTNAANANVSLAKVSGIYANMSNNSITATTFVGSLSGTATSATTAGTVTTAAQPNITSVGTLSSLTVTNKVTAGQLQGDGGNISNIQGGNVSGAVASATSATNASALLQNTSTATTVYPRFTTSSANGNSAAVFNTSISANLANASITATTFVGALSGAATSATTAGTVTTAAQPNITSVGTLTGLNLVSNTTFQPQIVSTNFTNDAFGPYWNTRKSRANAIVQNGDDLGTFMFSGHDGNTHVNSAYLVAEVDGNPTANSGFVPSLLGFYTSNTTALSSKLTIYGNGLASFAGVISGNGSALTSINGSNVTGTVANATFATSAGSATSATTAGTVTTAAQGNITSVGTLTSLSVSGALTTTQITAGANTTAGTITGNWTLTAGSRLQATYADLAENYVADATYEPGTVLSFGGEFEVTLANTFDSTRVAGVVTTDPAYIMNGNCEGEHVATIALQGRVPCKVVGPVSKGDLMVSSINGHASSNNQARAGTIIGKALENFGEGFGVIEVAVGRF